MGKSNGTTRASSKNSPKGLSAATGGGSIATTGVNGALNSALDRYVANADFDNMEFGENKSLDLGSGITVNIHKGRTATGVGILEAVARINGEEVADEHIRYNVNDDYEAVTARADMNDAIISAIIKNRQKIKV